jgi:P-type Ca2+ transporter type 2C
VLNDPASFAPIRGLSEADVQARRTPLRIVLEVLREPMLALLLGGGAIYLALGDLKRPLHHLPLHYAASFNA